MSVTGDKENWQPIGDAARLVDKSARTLRRWVTAGKLQSQDRDGRLWVEVSEYVPVDTTLADLKAEVDVLRSEVDKLSILNEQLTGERDYLRSALATALNLAQPAIGQPRRRWRWPWQDD